MNESQIRNKILSKFNIIINDLHKSKLIEESIYQYAINHICFDKNLPVNWDNIYLKRAYMNKAISIYTNISKNSYINNKTFLDKIINNKINLENIAFLKPQEIFPENWSDYIDKKKAKDEYLYTDKLECFTDEYKCGRCKKNKCSYYQLQLLSADESTSTIITCLNCGHKWKF